VVVIAEEHVVAAGSYFVRGKGFYCSLAAYGYENRGGDDAVWGKKFAGTSSGGSSLKMKVSAHLDN
jgi:hypothetical protein